jgi:septal ring factor EnvC (AmiA/AmiB activator)
MAADQALIKEMNVLQVKKLQELTLLKEKISVIDNLERTENERLVSLKQDNEIKIVLLMKIHKEKEFYATAVTELELASKKLKETIVSLDHQEIKISQSSSFAAARGKLFPPIEGRIVEVEKAATDNFNKIYKGIYIEGSTGDEVKAIFDGKIDYSGLLKGYGQIIVINHGSRYFTVSAHLGQRFKEKGDRVRKGEVIGLLESVESKIQPRLYFEIRQGGTSLSPLEWLKLH